MTTALTPSQAAVRLGLSKRRVLQLHDQGRIRATRTPLGRLFDVDDVERLALEREALTAKA